MLKITNMFKTGLVLLAAVMSVPAFAAAQFKVPMNYTVELVDGDSSNYDYSRMNRTITLTPGRHQIVIRFEGTFGPAKDARIVQSSNPLVIDIWNIADEEVMTFTYDMPQSIREAELYAKTEKINLIYADRRPVPEDRAAYFILASESGFSFVRDYRQDLMSVNRLYAPGYVQGGDRVMGMTSYGAPTITATSGVGASNTPQRFSMEAPMTSAAQESNLRTSSTSGGAVAGPQGKLRDLINLYNSADDKTKLEFVKYVMSN